MKKAERKIGIVGCGQVGMSYAFSLMHSGICDKLVLIDIDRRRIKAEAEDLRHGLCYLDRVTEVYDGDYCDLCDADIVMIAAGAAQKPGEDRMSLVQRNTEIFFQIIPKIVKGGFQGIYLIATNPVDIMARFAQALSNAPSNRVIGSGTMLDTARLRALLGSFFAVDPKNVHAYVLGEHGQSEFIPYSQARVGTKAILDICRENPARFPISYLAKAEQKTIEAASEIIAAKGATCYGIATALAKLTDAVFSDDQSIFTLSCHLKGEYGIIDTYVGVPAVITRQGIREIVKLSLTESELQKLQTSANYLKHMYDSCSARFV